MKADVLIAWSFTHPLRAWREIGSTSVFATRVSSEFQPLTSEAFLTTKQETLNLEP